MAKELWTTVRLFLWLLLLTGVAYPLAITGLSQIAMSASANGGCLLIGDTVVGSELIAQHFQDPKYFWSRPSAIDYNPLPSGGSNLGPTSAVLQKKVRERQEKLMQAHGLTDPQTIPSELVYASGSGLDPDISVEAALFQVDRIAQARQIEKEQLLSLIKQSTKRHTFGLLGPDYVNVLKLNLALDKMGRK